ncbi:MAG: effector-associated constant component EACC1 [Blastocatellia bacterium]
MEIMLSLSSDELDNDELQQLTRKLCRDLSDEAGADAALVTSEASPGTRGDLPVWGQIVMTLIGSGGVVVTAIKVLEAYVKKNRKVEVKVKTSKGEITIKTENCDSAEVISQVKALMTDDQQASN